MSWLLASLHFVGAMLAAVIVGSLVEYWVHRAMHARLFLWKKHARHHQRGTAQGWFGEFRDYFIPSLTIAWFGFPFSWSAGFGFFTGALLYAALAAYAHQIQHDNPDRCFWLKAPGHHLHHHHKMWHHNFGILTDVWDRIFGTYRQT